MKKYLLNPFNALYQDDTLLSSRPEIKELNQYAIDLEDQIEGDFNLEYLSFEFAYNQLAFVRNGLLLAKIKFLKLYKNYGDGTFASFCKYQLRKQRWQINDTIKAARVVLDLMYAGFDILPTNISQAVALAKLPIDELIEKWRKIIEILPLDKITAHRIRSLIFPEKESDKAVATIQVPTKVHEDIHSCAANRGLSIADFLIAMLEFFLKNEPNYYDEDRSINNDRGANSRATPRRYACGIGVRTKGANVRFKLRGKPTQPRTWERASFTPFEERSKYNRLRRKRAYLAARFSQFSKRKPIFSHIIFDNQVNLQQSRSRDYSDYFI